MFGLFKKRVKPDEQLISVIEYPEYFVFESYFQLESWSWKRTDLVSILPSNAGLAEKYKMVLKHLDLSKSVKEKDYDFDKMHENYGHKLDRNSIKKQMEGSKMVQISRKYGQIHFIPTKNGGTKGPGKGYEPLAGKEMTLEKTDINEESINLYLKESLRNCE